MLTARTQLFCNNRSLPPNIRWEQYQVSFRSPADICLFYHPCITHELCQATLPFYSSAITITGLQGGQNIPTGYYKAKQLVWTGAWSTYNLTLANSTQKDNLWQFSTGQLNSQKNCNLWQFTTSNHYPVTVSTDSEKVAIQAICVCMQVRLIAKNITCLSGGGLPSGELSGGELSHTCGK